MLEVGKVDKPHGVRGEVIVSLSTDRDERVATGSELRTKDGRVLRVESSRPHQNRWIVRFEGVGTREAADMLHGTLLYAEAIEDPDAFWIHDLIGCTVVDAANGETIGRVQSVEENPASDLLVLESGGLIPLRFVVDRGPGTLTVDIPEGLLE